MANSTDISAVLKSKNADIIRDAAAKAERDGRLTKTQLNLIYEQHWFKMFSPLSYGGLQLPLPDALALCEAISWADGSMGWEVALCALCGWSAAFIKDSDAKDLLEDSKVCFSGVGEATGTAEKTKDGYLINGKWKYATGANDATAFIVHCELSGNGNPSANALSVLLLKDEVNISSTWNAMGLIATASNNIEVKDLFISEDRAFHITNGTPNNDAPLYKYPSIQLGEAVLAITICGMAYHFVDLCQVVFSESKNRHGLSLDNDRTVSEIFEKYTQRLDDARTKLYYAADLSWQGCINFQKIKPAILYKVSAAAYEVAQRVNECIDALYPFCGMAAIDKASEINRVWRDLHTAGQHDLLVFGSLPE